MIEWMRRKLNLDNGPEARIVRDRDAKAAAAAAAAVTAVLKDRSVTGNDGADAAADTDGTDGTSRASVVHETEVTSVIGPRDQRVDAASGVKGANATGAPSRIYATV